MTITVEIDDADLSEDGAVQHFMAVLGGQRAQVRVDGYTLDGWIQAMSAR